MFKWKKLGKVFTPQEVEGRSWLKEFAQAPATLVFDDFLRIYDFLRVYFSCRYVPVNGMATAREGSETFAKLGYSLNNNLCNKPTPKKDG